MMDHCPYLWLIHVFNCDIQCSSLNVEYVHGHRKAAFCTGSSTGPYAIPTAWLPITGLIGLDSCRAELRVQMMSSASDIREPLMMEGPLETKVLNKMCRGMFSSSYPVFLTLSPVCQKGQGFLESFHFLAVTFWGPGYRVQARAALWWHWPLWSCLSIPPSATAKTLGQNIKLQPYRSAVEINQTRNTIYITNQTVYVTDSLISVAFLR